MSSLQDKLAAAFNAKVKQADAAKKKYVKRKFSRKALMAVCDELGIEKEILLEASKDYELDFMQQVSDLSGKHVIAYDGVAVDVSILLTENILDKPIWRAFVSGIQAAGANSETVMIFRTKGGRLWYMTNGRVPEKAFQPYIKVPVKGTSEPVRIRRIT